MLRLTVDQLRMAERCARRIAELEASKDSADATEAYAAGVTVFVPRQMVLDQIAEDLADAHARLAEMGIELLP